MTIAGINKPKWQEAWTQMQVRRYYRDYLRELGKLYPNVVAGIQRPVSMNQMLEMLIEKAGSQLKHRDMGASFTHTPDPYCGCSPEWPPADKWLTSEPDGD